MTWRRLLWRNLFFHWRGNLAVLLGVAVGTAVLTGALLVGDSLRGSLRDLTLRQLGWVDQALVTGRFVRERLAEELDAPQVCPALLLQRGASAERVGSGKRCVACVSAHTDLGNRFNLNPTPAPARNALVPLRLLQKQLGLTGRINARLVGGGTGDLQEGLRSHLSLDDWGL